MKISFAVNEKTSLIRITNIGNEETTIQIHALKWSQNEEGEESYEETEEIVIFPKIASLKKDREQIIRLGYQGNGTRTVEKTYRLIVEELPVKRQGEKTLRLVFKMRMPVFISPLKDNIDRSIERVWMDSRRLNVKVKNKGNLHFIVRKVRADGKNDEGGEAFSKETKGWYVLAGASGMYSIELTEEECLKTKSVGVTVEVDGSSMTSHLDVSDAMCLHRETTEVNTGGGAK